jgi:hypothetical protein
MEQFPYCVLLLGACRQTHAWIAFVRPNGPGACSFSCSPTPCQNPHELAASGHRGTVGDSTTHSQTPVQDTHIAALPLQIPPFWRSHAPITTSTVVHTNREVACSLACSTFLAGLGTAGGLLVSISLNLDVARNPDQHPPASPKWRHPRTARRRDRGCLFRSRPSPAARVRGRRGASLPPVMSSRRHRLILFLMSMPPPSTGPRRFRRTRRRHFSGGSPRCAYRRRM